MFRHKKLVRILIPLAVLLLILGGSVLAATANHHNRVIVSDTLEYDNVAWTTGAGRQESHFLTFRPGGDIRPIVSAGGRVFGAGNINTVMNHAVGNGHNVIGGVNADFFSFQTGIMEGIYISNGRFKSSHHGRSAVFFRADGSAFVSNPGLTITLSNQGGPNSNNAGRQVSVTHYNKIRQPAFLYLLDGFFSANTRTTTAGREVFFHIMHGRPEIGGEVQLEVVRIADSTGAVNIPAGQIVLSADRTSPHLQQLNNFAVGDRVTLRVTARDERVNEAVWATGGGDVLVRAGNRTTGWDSAIAGANPRTALGIREDGGIILYTVDGRQPGYSVGLSFNALADQMIALGAHYVVNLDGGGSTTFAFRYPGTSATAVRNRPSAGALRNCSTFILLTAPARDNTPTHMQFRPNGVPQVLAGTAVRAWDLYAGGRAMTMTDRGYFPLSPANRGHAGYSAANPALGEPEGEAFRVGDTAMTGRVTVHAANGARGLIEIEVITAPNRVDVRLAGDSISALRLMAGDTVRLRYYAYIAGRRIIAGQDAFIPTVTDGLAEIDRHGNLQVTGTPGERGTLAIATAGGTRHNIELIIAHTFADTDYHWAREHIAGLQELGVIAGVATERGTHFFPNQGITRAEFAALLTQRLGLDTSELLTGDEFLDDALLPEWARPFIAAVYHTGIMTGRAWGDGVIFAPGATITRAEVFTALGRLLEDVDADDILAQFSDAGQIPAWARQATINLIAAGIVSGGADGTLNPARTITRAEAAAILAQFDLSLMQQDPPPDNPDLYLGGGYQI